MFCYGFSRLVDLFHVFLDSGEESVHVNIVTIPGPPKVCFLVGF